MQAEKSLQVGLSSNSSERIPAPAIRCTRTIIITLPQDSDSATAQHLPVGSLVNCSAGRAGPLFVVGMEFTTTEFLAIYLEMLVVILHSRRISSPLLVIRLPIHQDPQHWFQVQKFRLMQR